MLGFGFPIIYLLSSRVVAVIIAGSLLVISVIFDVIRLRNRSINKIVFRKISVMKEKERQHISSTTWFLLGVLISFLVFPKGIAVLAVAFTVIGDAVAEIIGTRFRRIKMLDKSLEGNLACFLSCFFIGLVFSMYVDVSNFILLLGALAATVAQALPLRIDDNLGMQLIAGIVMMVVG